MAQLLPAVDRVDFSDWRKKPQQMVADSGYTTRGREYREDGWTRRSIFCGPCDTENVPRGANLEKSRFPPERISLYLQPEKEPLLCVCPEGKVLLPAGERRKG